MPSPRVLILRAPGTNCDEETAHAFSLAGGMPDRWHVNAVLQQPARIADFQIFCIPGGFSYGDDVAAGRILGNQMRHHLADALHAFREAGKLILGICNGFQVLLKTALLAAYDDRAPAATLTWNDSGRFEDRWVRLGTDGGKCVFLRDIEEMYLPVAHAEGKFVARDEETLRELDVAGHLVLRYLPAEKVSGTFCRSRPEGCSAQKVPDTFSDTIPFPDNPNGSQANVAGVCDAPAAYSA